MRLAARAVAVAAVFGTIELLSMLAATVVPDLRIRFYVAPVTDNRAFTEYLQTRHPVLGWPSTKMLQELTPRGMRPSPANAKYEPSSRCVSVYGDSFTFSSEATDQDAWPNQLAERLGIPVHNFGVDGYGVDQAVLRHSLNETDTCTVTILGVFSDDIVRSLNQWNYLRETKESLRFSFKPVFVLDGDRLRLEPIKVQGLADYRRIAAAPDSLTEDWFRPNGAFGPVHWRFPYSVSTAKLGLRLIRRFQWNRIRAFPSDVRRWNRPFWREPGLGLSPYSIALQRALVDMMLKDCRERDKKCYVLLIPSIDELMAYRNIEDISLALESIYEERIETWNPTGVLAEAVDNVCGLFTDETSCAGHYNVTGYTLLARYVADRLQDSQ